MTKRKKSPAKVSDQLEIKILTVVGARPNFMKAAPLIRAINEHNETGKSPRLRHLLVHTGQHYGELMSDRFFEDLNLPKPDVHLGVGSGTHGVQTAEILRAFEETLSREWPHVVVVVGDVNSTVACALTTAKLPATAARPRPLIAHIEAGLRSFDREMPEEINRIVTDHLADLLFVTEKSGLANLRREGISAKKVFFVGNTMIDSLLASKAQADQSQVLERLGLREKTTSNGNLESVQPYALLTLHRPSNVDNLEAFGNVLKGLAGKAQELPIIFPVHPRTRKKISEFGLEKYFNMYASKNQPGIILTDPLGYLDFLCLMKNASLVLTDSGGVQEETTCLGVPCVTIRENTERPVTVSEGTNTIAGTTAEGIRKAIARKVSRKHRGSIPAKWDGKAAQRIVPILIKEVRKSTSRAGN
jgi:UDP-N-acetylglucosamine 2-epimerase (non-hydrolysing)